MILTIMIMFEGKLLFPIQFANSLVNPFHFNIHHIRAKGEIERVTVWEIIKFISDLIHSY